ncbi:MAG: aminotransferase class III-fold pyridoxal phosphate-dependent enzyme [Ideonella sp.]|nr:aminotransferase class III-fold pyridoxal phosphate-dependent enzyme [Ideonella sp.]
MAPDGPPPRPDARQPRQTSSPGARAPGSRTSTAQGCSTAWPACAEQQPRPGHTERGARRHRRLQLDGLPLFNTFRGTTHPRAIKLSAQPVALLRRRTALAAVMFSNGGSDSVEAALQALTTVPQAARREGPAQVHRPAPGYLRRAAPAGSGERQHQLPPGFEPLLRALTHRFALALPQRLHQAKRKLGRIVAQRLDREIVLGATTRSRPFIAEPIRGAGGLILPPANYCPLVARRVRQARRAADRRAGWSPASAAAASFSATRLWGVQADLWCLAGHLQRLRATGRHHRRPPRWQRSSTTTAPAPARSRTGYTYSAHPVAAARRLATLKVLVDGHPRQRNAGRPGAFQLRLRALMQRHDFVGDVRGRGLMLEHRDGSRPGAAHALAANERHPRRVARDLTTRPDGARLRAQRSLILSPPLAITTAELDFLYDTPPGAAFDAGGRRERRRPSNVLLWGRRR